MLTVKRTVLAQFKFTLNIFSILTLIILFTVSFISSAASSVKLISSGDENNVFNAERLLGKRISFVSINSTSGFTLPAKLLQSALKAKDSDELIKEGLYFSKVIFKKVSEGFGGG